MSDLGKIEGKTFLITGGSSGLGAAYIEPFLKEGAKKVAILDIAEETGKAVAERINKSYPGKVVFVKCDISKEENIEAAFNEVVSRFGTIDVIINNAGILNDSPNMWRKACDVNYAGVVSFNFKAIKHMRVDEGGKGGTIINVASEMAFLKMPYIPVYAGTKAAVLHFSLSLSRDPFHEITGVRLLTMCFGATNTGLVQNVGKTAYDETFNKLMLEMSSSQVNDSFALQSAEAGAKCVVDVFKRGSNGSVWLSHKEMPAIDITEDAEAAGDNVKNKHKLSTS